MLRCETANHTRFQIKTKKVIKKKSGTRGKKKTRKKRSSTRFVCGTFSFWGCKQRFLFFFKLLVFAPWPLDLICMLVKITLANESDIVFHFCFLVWGVRVASVLCVCITLVSFFSWCTFPLQSYWSLSCDHGLDFGVFWLSFATAPACRRQVTRNQSRVHFCSRSCNKSTIQVYWISPEPDSQGFAGPTSLTLFVLII